MKLMFRLVGSCVNPEETAVEVLKGGCVIGVIYSEGERSLRIVSANVDTAGVEKGFAGDVEENFGPPGMPRVPSYVITFREGPYKVLANKQLK